VLQSADDEEQSDAGDAGRPFTVVASRRLKRLRNRTTPSSRQQKNTANTANPPQRNPQWLGSLRPRVVISQLPNRVVLSLSGVLTIWIQHVQCVSEQQSISVLSCFETKSQRRRGETTTDDRKPFRVYIYEEDSVRLLDSSVWPHSVVVLNVIFKSLLTDLQFCQYHHWPGA